jgi:hypothetical protein
MNLKTLLVSTIILLSFSLWADSDMERLVYIKGEKLTAQQVLAQVEDQLGFRLTLKAVDKMAYVKDYDDLVSFSQIISALSEYYRVHNGVVLESRSLGRGRYVFETQEMTATEEVLRPALVTPRMDMMAPTADLVDLGPSEVKNSSVSESIPLKHSPLHEELENPRVSAPQLELEDLAESPVIQALVVDEPMEDKRQWLEVEVLGRHIKAPDLDSEATQPRKVSENSYQPELLDLDEADESSASSTLGFKERMEVLGLRWPLLTGVMDTPKYLGVNPLLPMSPALVGFVMMPDVFDVDQRSGWGVGSSLNFQDGSSGAVEVDLKMMILSPYYRWALQEWTVEHRLDAMLLDGEVTQGNLRWSGSTFTASSITSSVERDWLMPLDHLLFKTTGILKLPLDTSVGVESSGSVDVGLVAGLEQKIPGGRLALQAGILHCGEHKFYGDTNSLTWDGRFAVEQDWQQRTYRLGFVWSQSPLESSSAKMIDGQILRFELGCRDHSGRLPFGIRLYVGASEASTDWGLSIDW